VAAFLAGVDMILQPADFDAAAAGMTRAAGEGVITEGRIDESLTRIFRAKITAGLITLPGG
jgi:beta-N-acetylhexosaminidase